MTDVQPVRPMCKDYFECPKLNKFNRSEFDGRFITRIWADICAKCFEHKPLGEDNK